MLEIRDFEDAVRSQERAVYQVYNVAEHKRSYADQRRIFPALLDHYYPLEADGDGHCLFHAISLTLFGHQRTHFSLRLLCCKVFSDNWDYFRMHHPGLSEIGDLRRIVRNTAINAEKDLPVHQYGHDIHTKALSIAANREIQYFPALPQPMPANLARLSTEQVTQFT